TARSARASHHELILHLLHVAGVLRDLRRELLLLLRADGAGERDHVTARIYVDLRALDVRIGEQLRLDHRGGRRVVDPDAERPRLAVRTARAARALRRGSVRRRARARLDRKVVVDADDAVDA